jgi:transposase
VSVISSPTGIEVSQTGVGVSQIGIDVSKDWLDASVDGGAPFRIDNSRAAGAALAGRLPASCVVHPESSGGYERVAVRALREAGVEVRVHDPLRARRIAQAKEGWAKTGPVDARNLARHGARLEPGREKPVARESLCDLSRAIDGLTAAAAAFKVRARRAGIDPEAGRALPQAAGDPGRRADAPREAFEARARPSPLARRFEPARGAPGVGPGLARAVARELADGLAPLGTGQIASCAGLAPIDSSSGRRTGRTWLARGDARIKRALYMPALSALASQPWARELYDKLKAKGKARQQAIVAVMRRLLVRIVAVLKRGTPWKDDPPRP